MPVRGVQSPESKPISGPRGRTRQREQSLDSDVLPPDSQYVESATDEMFSGAVSESVPSSYVTYHPYHARSASRSLQPNGLQNSVQNSFSSPRISRERSMSRSSVASSMRSLGGGADYPAPGSHHRSESRSSFRFFSWDEVQAAEGTGTDANELDPIEFVAEQEQLDSPDIFSSSIGGSLKSPRPHRESVFSAISVGDDEPLLQRVESTTSNLVTHTSKEAHRFYVNSKRLQQRFYISQEDLVVGIAGYKSSKSRQFIYIILCIITLGMAYLVLRWIPRLWIKLLGTPSPLGQCHWLVVENQWGQLDFVTVNSRKYNKPMSTIFNLKNSRSATTDVSSVDTSVTHTTFNTNMSMDTSADLSSTSAAIEDDPIVPILRSAEYRYIKLYYNPLEDLYMTNLDWIDPNWEDVDYDFEGLDSDQLVDRSYVFGPNIIDIEDPPIVKLLIDEVLHPFYVFQVFSILLWSLDEYYYYASCIFLISLISVGNALIETKRTMNRMREISRYVCRIRVLRNEFWTDVPSSELVPGDIFEVSDPAIELLPCDCVLLSGDCIVNESMLTGESVPVSKVPVTAEALKEFSSTSEAIDADKILSRNLLYNGTKIVKVTKPKSLNDEGEYDVALAMVLRTGFSTTKGALVRSMLFPKPSGFKFYSDSFKYIGVMGLIAAFGFVGSTINFVKMHMATKLIIFRAFDLITIVVPPALPATLTIGTNISLSRLKEKLIFCISPSRVNVGGKLDVICFDKTGTLTEDGLDVLGVQEVDRNSKSKQFLPLGTSIAEVKATNLTTLLATCHSLRLINDELIGDPLDAKMFEFSGWTFQEKDLRGGQFMRVSRLNNTEALTVKVFEFVSSLRRMSVIVKQEEGLFAYLKGAPEIMRDVCDPSTFPDNYEEQLHQYTHQGYRVIACAYKSLSGTKDDQIASLTRNNVESQLKFAGFTIFENKLKPSSTGVIETLDKANIRTVMCTGDNVLTAISVGKECNIIPNSSCTVYAAHFVDDLPKWHSVDDQMNILDMDLLRPVSLTDDNYVLAVTGEIFRYYVEEGTEVQLQQILMKGAIFARMSPDEKHELVEKLQDLQYTTGFCGDGANDCGALKAADVGISLSEAEASVAASFTSRKFEISCVVDIIKEGRCALATSFSCFKYMSLYSAIQFVSVTLLYGVGSNLGDFQFLWIDLFLILPIAIFMAWSRPSAVLSKRRPTANLVSRKVLVPLLGHIALFTGFQLWMWNSAKGIKKQGLDWYVPPVEGGDDSNVDSTENTTIFAGSCFQYIFIAVILAKGPPFREALWKNWPFCLTILVTWLTSMTILDLDNETSWMGKLMNMTYTPRSYELKLMEIVFLNILASWLSDHYVYPRLVEAIAALKRSIGIVKVRKLHKVLKDQYKLDV